MTAQNLNFTLPSFPPHITTEIVFVIPPPLQRPRPNHLPAGDESHVISGGREKQTNSSPAGGSAAVQERRERSGETPLVKQKLVVLHFQCAVACQSPLFTHANLHRLLRG